MWTEDPIGFPPCLEMPTRGMDKLGTGCRVSASVTIFRAPNRYANAGIFIGDGVMLFDHVRLLLGEADTRLDIGDRVIANVGCYLSGEGGLSIGEDTLIGPHARLLSAGHEIHGGAQVVARNPINGRPIRIGRGAWIGGGATILAGVRIGDGAVVGAGSVVTHDVPDFAVAVGNPARVVRYRQGCRGAGGLRQWLRRVGRWLF